VSLSLPDRARLDHRHIGVVYLGADGLPLHRVRGDALRRDRPPHAAGLFGPGAPILGGESAGRLTAGRITEFHQRLEALVAEYFASDAVEWTSPVKYGFRYVLMPIDIAPDDDPRAIRDGT